ncbi:MAG: hypothetical protein OXH52_12515 [Gammaproteobacteria bacterium]|nr:hypothetical protein [Gammaproteobacteria bacterium]
MRRWQEQAGAGPLRAYFARVAYARDGDTSIALCIASERDKEEQLVEATAAAFQGGVQWGEHQDMLLVDEQQERRLRKVCCPFFGSARFTAPDFWLRSAEGYDLEDPRAYYKERSLAGGHGDGYMVCEIDPPIIGQRYGLGACDIDRVVFASRHEGVSLFPIEEWPAYVHVGRLTVPFAEDEFALKRDDLRVMAWAELYESRPVDRPGVSQCRC